MEAFVAWLKSLGRYRKFFVSVVGAGLTVATVVWGGSNHWVALAVAVAGALGVYTVPNDVKPQP
jgi:flavoprotein